MRIRTAILAIALWQGTASAQLTVDEPPPVHPSNGLLEISARPALGHDPRPYGMRTEPYLPWRGLVLISIRNITQGVLQVREVGALSEYGIQIVDLHGNLVERTPLGGRSVAPKISELARAFESVALIRLEPTKEKTAEVGLWNYFNIQPGHGYRVLVRRSVGFPETSPDGRPLADPEVSCYFDVPARGLPTGRGRL